MSDWIKKITDEQWEELSDYMLNSCRWLDDSLQPKGGWNGWTTGGMRMMTDSILRGLLAELDKINLLAKVSEESTDK